MKKYLFITAFCLFTLFVFNAEAQSGQNNPNQSGQNVPVSGALQNPFRSGGDSVITLFATIVEKILIPIGAVAAVIAFIYTGFLFVMAQGNDSKLKEAKAALLYTVIGTAILLGAGVLTSVITNTVNSLR